MKNILFINSTPHQCGVYEFGVNTFNVIKKLPYNFTYLELDTQTMSNEDEGYDLVIVNYHPSTLPNFKCKNHIKYLLMQHDADYDFKRPNISYVHMDPLFEEKEQHYKVGRFLIDVELEPSFIPNRIGTLGFATFHKEYERIYQILNNTLDEGEFLIHVPQNDYVDPRGTVANKIVSLAKAILKPQIKLMVSRNYLDTPSLIKLFSSCEANILYYSVYRNSAGCSSAADILLSTRRPLAINSSIMFRHILNETNLCDLTILPFKEIINRGTKYFDNIYRNWTTENVAKDYQRIIESII